MKEQQELQKRMEQKQMKEFMTVRLYSGSPSYRSARTDRSLTDLLQPSPAMLRRLRQRLHHQVPHLTRGRLRLSMCG